MCYLCDNSVPAMLKSVVAVSAASAAVSWAYLRHIMLRAGPNRLDWSQHVVGHRGCRFVQGAPENTLPAFQYALTQKATGIELDVRLCKSGELVVFHDAFLSPLFDTEEKEAIIASKTLDELRAMRFAADESKVQQIPTLEEVILFCKTNDTRVVIEVKTVSGRRQECAERLLETYERHSSYLYQRATLVSFDPFVLYAVRQRDPDVAVGIFYHETIVSDLIKSKIDVCPALWRTCPPFFDWLLATVLSRIAPWVVGASVVGTHYRHYTTELHRRWFGRKILLYLWGFEGPEKCTDDMKMQGAMLCVDDHHSAFFARPREWQDVTLADQDIRD